MNQTLSNTRIVVNVNFYLKYLVGNNILSILKTITYVIGLFCVIFFLSLDYKLRVHLL